MNASSKEAHDHHISKYEGDSSKISKATGTTTTTPSSSTPWLRLRDPRIVRVSRAFGGKDRHSKVCTIRGLRDRRVRLSVPTAIQLYDLQDRLGLNQPSKVVDWLLNVAKDEIDQLPPLPISPNYFTHQLPIHHHHQIGGISSSSIHEDQRFAAKSKGIASEEDDKQSNDHQGFFINNNALPYGTSYNLYPLDSNFSFNHHHHNLQNLNDIPLPSMLSLQQPYHNFSSSTSSEIDPRQINHLMSTTSLASPQSIYSMRPPFNFSMVSRNINLGQAADNHDTDQPSKDHRDQREFHIK